MSAPDCGACSDKGYIEECDERDPQATVLVRCGECEHCTHGDRPSACADCREGEA